jgi:nucleoside-diphosphate-sugar epimerase
MNLSHDKTLILGCGYVGFSIAEYWQTLGRDLIVTTTSPSKLVTLEQYFACAVLLQGEDENFLTHLLTDVVALVILVGARGASYEATYLGTARAIARALECNTTVRQVIYTSSYAVYGDQSGNWVDEATPVQPVNANGQILAETEQVLLSCASPKRAVCVFRLGGIYGPGRDLGQIFGSAAGTVRPGTGEEPSNWIHLEDVVGAISFAVERHLDGIYNLVSEPIRIGELLDRVCRAYNLAPIRFDPSLASQRPYHAQVSNRKLCKAGYEFRHPAVLPELGRA